MDYSKFIEFPFPSSLPKDDLKLKDYFMDLPDEEQLNLLNGSQSYREFRDRIVNRLQQV